MYIRKLLYRRHAAQLFERYVHVLCGRGEKLNQPRSTVLGISNRWVKGFPCLEGHHCHEVVWIHFYLSVNLDYLRFEIC